MPTGTVKWFNSEKGFGFIVPDAGGDDVFVHISAVKQAGFEVLEENTKLNFDLREGRNGRVSAVDLEIGDSAGGNTNAESAGTAGGIFPVLYTADLSVTETFYRRVLGFEVTGEYEEDGERTWIEVTRDGARISFTSEQVGDLTAPVFSGMLYIMTPSVDQVAASITSSSAIKWGPEDKPHGLRELCVEDTNGYLLVFAQQI